MSLPKNFINKRVIAPKYFSTSAVFNFIEDIQFVFKNQNKIIPGFNLDLSKIKEASLLGTLTIYKFIEYTALNHCFSNPKVAFNDNAKDALSLYGFSELVSSYVKSGRARDSDYRNLSTTISKKFIIAPQALLRNDKLSKKELNDKFLPLIEGYYDYNEKVVSMIFLALSEILLNFWEHAVEDTKSIIVANGDHNRIEIACADTGDGIVSTLRKDYPNADPEFILSKAVLKGITSKKNSNHMGYGLWILDEIVSRAGGRMHIYSQGAVYYNENGKKRVKKCGYWQGTIIYMSLLLKNPVTLSDIEKESLNSNSDLKINWL